MTKHMATAPEGPRRLRGLTLSAWVVLACLGHVALVLVGAWGMAEPALWLVVVGLAGLAGSLLMARLCWRTHGWIDQAPDAASHARQLIDEVDPFRLQLRAAEVRLREVIDAVPAGVAIYDNQDRLMLFNQEVARQFPYCSEQPVLGETYEALMRRALAEGRIADAVDREDEWLTLRMAGRGALDTPLLRHTDDGHWVHFYEIRTPSGYLVMTRLDMTPMVEKGLALERANEQLLRLSTTDGLTGIANRRLFDQVLHTEWQRCARNRVSLSLLMIDIDHFKRYNDFYGHQTGDECLRQVARVLVMCAKRSGDLVARYGGEEFAILLPNTDVQEAMAIAQRCLNQLESAHIPHADSPVSPWLTVSIGVGCVDVTPAKSSVTLVQQADSALYCAKKAGRARVDLYDPETVSALATRPAPL